MKKDDFHMEIEIIEFYPTSCKSKNIYGRLHVYLCDYDMDIRGIEVRKSNKQNFSIWMPSARGQSAKDKEWTRYSVFQFANNQKTESLKVKIQQKLTKFLDSWFSEHPECAKLAEKMVQDQCKKHEMASKKELE